MDNIINFVTENIFALITAIVAIIAICQTKNQIKISNKQFLFKNRVEKYTMIIGLLQLYEESESTLEYSRTKEDEPIIVDFQFENLTNIGYLKDITKLIYEPRNNQIRIKFLLKLEELKNIANECKFLFKGEKGKIIKDFIYNYQNLLRELYGYQVFENLMRDNKEQNIIQKTYGELQKEFDEYSHRGELYVTINKLKNSYYKLKRKIKKIEKDIKL